MVTASARWTRGMQFVAECDSGHSLVLDSAPAEGARSTGPTPMELVLMGLAGCTGIDMVFILRERMKKDVTGVEVRVSGARAEEAPKVYTAIDVTYEVRGPGLPVKDALRAMRLSAEKYCSVSAMLAKSAVVRWHYELVDETSGEATRGTLEDVAH